MHRRLNKWLCWLVGRIAYFQWNVHSVYLHIVTSALHVDTLAILAGELICKAGTQLKEDAGKIQAKRQQKW